VARWPFVPGLVGVGLGLVTLGSGALKANASSLLGTLYDKGDARADGGFTVFLPWHQPGWIHRPADHRTAADPRRLPLRVRCARRRHGTRPRPVRGVSAKSRHARGREVPNSLPHNRIALYAGVAVLGAVAIAVGLVVLGLASWISRLMEGVH